MKRSYGRSNALLVELLIVVMFFMLAAAFLMQMFAAARKQGEDAGLLNEVLVRAQNIAEVVYAAEDPAQALSQLGFTSEADGSGEIWRGEAEGLVTEQEVTSEPEGSGEIWRSEADGLVTEVQMQAEETAAGRMVMQTVRVLRDGELLIELPVAKYEEVRP